MLILLGGLLSVNWLIPAQADTASGPSLVISQFKISSTNGQFVTLYNTTDTYLDMSKYQLQYFNNFDLSKATSSKLITLSGIVPPHGYLMVNDGALLLCYRLTINSVSLGLSSTAGLIQVLSYNQSSPGSAVTSALQDYVSWSKAPAAGAQTLPAGINAFLERQPVDGQNKPAVAVPGAGSWQSLQPETENACNLVTNGPTGPVAVQTGLNQLLPASEPLATMIIPATGSAASAPAASLPPADIGLKAPAVTELLPNPVGTGNDASDEFIEIYNPNSVSFDLSGFSLQAGNTTLRTYLFPVGTTLAANSFTVFKSAVTGLSLSNSGGQSKLLDPFNKSISESEAYATAKDGQTWALANSKWYWTTSPTPGAANVIKQPTTTKKAAAAKTNTPKSKAATAAKKSTTATSTAASSGTAFPEETSTLPIHARTLALVAGLALLYGAYEYRTDLANRLHQLRGYFGNRRGDR